MAGGRLGLGRGAQFTYFTGAKVLSTKVQAALPPFVRSMSVRGAQFACFTGTKVQG